MPISISYQLPYSIAAEMMKIDRLRSSVWTCTFIVIAYTAVALATSTCPRNYFLNSEGRCRGCNSCLPGVKSIARCTETHDTVCHPDNKCYNPLYVYDARYDYHCRAVRPSDCTDRRLVSSTPTNCSTKGSNCTCRVVSSDHRKVDCYCETGTPTPTKRVSNYI